MQNSPDRKQSPGQDRDENDEKGQDENDVEDDDDDLPQLRIIEPGEFEDIRSVNPLEKIDDLCDHLVEQIRGQGESSRMDSRIC